MQASGKIIPFTTRLEDIDPATAWQNWEPSDEEPWNDLRASLLHRCSTVVPALTRPKQNSTPHVQRQGMSRGPNWINSSTLVGFANWIYELIHHETTRYEGVSLDASKPERWAHISMVYLASLPQIHLS